MKNKDEFIITSQVDLPSPFDLQIYNSVDAGYVNFVFKKDVPELFQKSFEKFHHGMTYQIDETAYASDYVNWAKSVLREIEKSKHQDQAVEEALDKMVKINQENGLYD